MVCNSDANYQYPLASGWPATSNFPVFHKWPELDLFTDSINDGVDSIECAERPSQVAHGWEPFGHEKSPEVFARARRPGSRSSSDVVFVHVGDGPLRNTIEALSHDLGISNSFLLLGQRTDVPRLLSGMDVFVLTSHTEGLPNALMEAYGSRFTLCGDRRRGGCREVVNDGEYSDFVVPIGDEETVADLDRQTASRRRTAASHGSGVLVVRRCEPFDCRLMAERYGSLYSLFRF